MQFQKFFALAILAFLLACGGNPEPASTGNVLVLDDFENADSLARWEGPLSLSTEKVCHGTASARIDLSDRRARFVVTEKLPGDWSGYDRLKFDIFNPSGTVEVAGIQIWDTAGSDEEAELRGQSYRGGKLYMNPGWNHFEFYLREAMVEEGDRPLAVDRIRRFRLDFGRMNGEMFLDNLRLVAGEEGPATASAADPRDCRVEIRNRFTFPSLYGPADKIKVSAEMKKLRVRARQAMAELEEDVKVVELQGYQPYYWKIPLITAQIGLGVRSKLAWYQTEEKEKETLEYVIQSCEEGREKIRKLLAAADPDRVELPEDEVNPHIMYAPPYPVLRGLKQKDGYFRDELGRPVIVFSVLNVNEGPLMDYFAPFNHRLESYTVGGGSRYDVESSPVYEAFHKYPDTHRVGWDGWCGHLIKDRWSMGGRKESVVICLESPHIREAVWEYTKYRYDLWKRNPNLMYNIMAYELMYICYCETSQQMFRDWLRDKYGSVAELNAVWNTSYGNFAEIAAPATSNAAPLPDVNRAAWYDWATFNARRFTDYLKYCKSQIRRLDPDMPITAGGTSSMLSAANGTSGIDEELMINEVDDVILNESGSSHIFSDLFLSLADRKMPMVEPEMGGHPRGTLLHFLKGKSSVSKWWWARTPSLEYHGMNESSLPHGWDISLGEVAEMLRIGLDVRRLAEEIAAFTEPQPEIAILYSQSSIVQVPPQVHRAGRTPYLEALQAAWEGSRYLGCRIGFVTERQIARGKLSAFKLLIVPAAKYIQPETVNRILAWVELGGTALVVPESFLFDQYARASDRTGELGLKVTDVILPKVLGQGELVQNYDQSFTQTLVYGEVNQEITPGREDIFAGRKPVVLHSSGLVQKIDPGKNEVLAKFADGGPALVLVRKGSGSVYYLASPLAAKDYQGLLEPLAERLGVQRPLVGIASDGGLVTGAEVRAVERPSHFLMYASNLTADKLEFDIRGKAYEGEVTDLRSLEKVPAGHVALGPWQETIFRIEKQKLR